jgi:ribonuclease P/MRP protein subunit RPP1
MAAAVKSGIRFEICYAGGVGNADAPRGAGAEAGMTRRNMIANATALIRATGGKGIIISSEAGRALACRGPWDVGNLSVGWGLSGERGREAVGREPRGVVVRARDMKEGWRGVIDVVFGGEKTETSTDKATAAKGKRKAEVLEEAKEADKPVSKREMKRSPKQTRLETQTNPAANKDKVTIGKIVTAPHTTDAAAKSA